jgi:hypothetical protein
MTQWVLQYRINAHVDGYHDALLEHFFEIEKDVNREGGYTRVTG